MASTLRRLSATVGTVERELSVAPPGEGDGGRWRVVLDGVERLVDARPLDGGTWSLLIDGKQWIVDVEAGKDGDPIVEVRGVAQPVKLVDPRRRALAQAAQRAKAASGPDALRAPMPGKI